MKIALLIDSLGSGGAERQLVELATGLKTRGHEVQVIYYHQNDFFKSFLEDAGVSIVRLNPKSKLGKLASVKLYLNNFRPDIVHAFGRHPSMLAVLSNLPAKKWKVVVTEWFSYERREFTRIYIMLMFDLWLSRNIFRFADHIVTESHQNRLKMNKYSPFLSRKVSVILNGIDIEKFVPSDKSKRDKEAFRFVCVASVIPRKNVIRVIEALKILKNRCNNPFHLTWIGSYRTNDENNPIYIKAMDKIKEYGLDENFSFLGKCKDIPKVLNNYDAIVLASLQEGMPNALLEGMAAGLPAVASAISDIPVVVKEGTNGFLCNPLNPESIAEALQRMLELDVDAWHRFSSAARESVETMFSKKRFIDEYEALYNRLLQYAHR